MAKRTVFNGDKDATNWVKMEQARLKNLELECIDILNDRDNESLMLRMRIRDLEKENRALTTKSKKQEKHIEELNSLYNYGYGRTI